MDKLGIKHEHDSYSNFITILANNFVDAVRARNLILSDIFDACDITKSDLEYISEKSDLLEIKIL